MRKFHKGGMVFLVLFFFIFTLVMDAYQETRGKEKEGIQLMNGGESLYEKFQYEEAAEKFKQALFLLRSEENLARCYLGLSKSYYAMGDQAKIKEMLWRLFEIFKDRKIDITKYPHGFVRFYLDTQKEYSQTAIKSVVKERADSEKKRRKRLWLYIVGSVVLVGIVLIFIFSKKKDEIKQYSLTVTKGNGVLGAPENGTFTYNDGQIVEYNYSLSIDYLFYDLVVKLDGEPVPASGSFVMDQNHSLYATAQGWWLKRKTSSPGF